jgi:hypothetical protein
MMHYKSLMRPVTQLSVLIVITLTLSGCGESYSSQALAYSKAAEEALVAHGACVNAQDCASKQLVFWAGGNPWFPGKNKAYVNLYRTKDAALVSAVAQSIKSTKAKLNGPPCQLTTYSSAHSESNQEFDQISIE